MNKWYRSCGWMLVAAMMMQLSGCAQRSSWLSRVTGRDKADQKLVDVDGREKSKSSTAKKSSSSKTSRDSDDKSSDSQLAKKSPSKSKKPTGDSSKSEVASTRDVVTNRTGKKSNQALDPFLDEEIASTDSKKALAEKKTETKSDVGRKKTASADPFSEQLPEAEIAQTSAQSQQEKTSDSKEVASRVREAAHKSQDSLADLPDLPEWALEGEIDRAAATAKQATRSAKSELSQAKTAATTTAKKATRSAEQLQKDLESALKEPAPAGPSSGAGSTPSAATLVSLCPAAKGELRETLRALNTSDSESLKRDLHRIGRMGPEAAAAAPAIRQLLNHKDGYVRIHAALALTRMQQSSPEVIQAVIGGLKSTDPGLRSFAAATLAEMGPGAGEALKILANSLEDRDGYVRLHAAEVLIRYEQWSYRSLETLLECLTDKDENVRWLATYSLAELAPEAPEAVAALAKATRDPVPKVQIGAVYALGEIGPFAKKSAPALHRIADETTNTELQSAVLYALQQIEQ